MTLLAQLFATSSLDRTQTRLVDRKRADEVWEHSLERSVRRGLSTLLLWWHRRRGKALELGEDAWIIAPHPDDEVLGCGGTIIHKRRQGASVRVVFLTDGSASHGDAIDRTTLAARRTGEARRACAMLGVPGDHVHFLNLPDGLLHERAGDCVRELRHLFAQFPYPQLFVPNRYEGASDHLDARRSALAALDRSPGATSIVEYGVWSWHNWPLVQASRGGGWPRRLGRRVKQFCRTVAWLASCRATVDVTAVAEQKRRALMQHESQAVGLPEAPGALTLSDVSGGEFLERLMGPFEIFGVPYRR